MGKANRIRAHWPNRPGRSDAQLLGRHPEVLGTAVQQRQVAGRSHGADALALHDPDEVREQDLLLAVAADVDDVLQLLVLDLLPRILAELLEVGHGDLASTVSVEELESRLHVIFGRLVLHHLLHHAQELVVLDLVVRIVAHRVFVVVAHLDERVHVLLARVQAERLQGGRQLLERDGAGAVLVEEVEAVLDVLDHLRGELLYLLLGRGGRLRPGHGFEDWLGSTCFGAVL
mmetsp:Transcript_69/g.245  ORF Transcript_69/g.245 Transcript_69/m.245 type:complete len:231 (+) Transcript_69:140-832(+)